jgi:hypothetical protein
LRFAGNLINLLLELLFGFLQFIGQILVVGLQAIKPLSEVIITRFQIALTR